MPLKEMRNQDLKKKQKYIMKFSEETKLFSIQNRDTASRLIISYLKSSNKF